MTSSMPRILAALCGLLLAVPVAAEEAAQPEPEGPAQSQPADDPLTARLKQEVARYYTGIGSEATEAEMQSGLQSAQFMLLDGVSIERITAAVDKAISLHNPGRRITFEVAVPLRVLPAAEAGSSPAQTTEPKTSEASADDPLYDPERDERRARRKAAIEARRNRIRLHRQWERRTIEKRVLLSVGVPGLIIPYTMGFFIAGIMNMNGDVPHSWAWITSLPVLGTALLGIWTEGDYPWFAPLTVLQASGLALAVVGLALKVDRPYDKDPTALHIGRRRDGRSALSIRAGPMGLGGFLEGRF